MRKNQDRSDKSEFVSQREKIKDILTPRKFNWTPKQEEFLSLAAHKNTKIMFVSGPAGSSKTLMAVFSALNLLNNKSVSDILYIRSAVESSDSKLGFLPGEMDDKMFYYKLPLLEKLDELLPKAQSDALIKDNRISMFPINFARGSSWNAKCVIFDEAQNSSQKEIITLLTRLGKFSKCFVLADPYQTDLPYGRAGGYERIKNLFTCAESKEIGIHHFEFSEEDVMRSELVKFLTKKFKLLV